MQEAADWDAFNLKIDSVWVLLTPDPEPAKPFLKLDLLNKKVTPNGKVVFKFAKCTVTVSRKWILNFYLKGKNILEGLTTFHVKVDQFREFIQQKTNFTLGKFKWRYLNCHANANHGLSDNEIIRFTLYLVGDSVFHIEKPIDSEHRLIFKLSSLHGCCLLKHKRINITCSGLLELKQFVLSFRASVESWRKICLL